MLKCNYVVIGAGRTGLILSQEIANTGKKVVLIEQAELGGSYLMSQEIPRTFLLHESIQFADSLKLFKDYPDTFNILRKHRQKLHTRLVAHLEKQKVIIEDNLQNINSLTIINGVAEFVSKSLIEVNSKEERHLISFDQAIITTGKDSLSEPDIPGLNQITFFHQHSVNLFSHTPSKLAIIGVTPESLEVASIYSDLGVKVDIFDALDVNKVCVELDKTALNFIIKKLLSKRVEFHFKSKVEKVSMQDDEIVIHCGLRKKYTTSHIYFQLKESFSSESLNLEKIGVRSSKLGINTTTTGQTTHKHIWAFGKCTQQNDFYQQNSQIHSFLKKIYEHNTRNDIMNAITGNTNSEIKTYKVKKVTIQSDQPVVAIGYSESQARLNYGSQIKTDVIEDILYKGFLKITYRENSGQILGLVLAGDFATKLENVCIKSMDKAWQYKDLRNFLKVTWGI